MTGWWLVAAATVLALTWGPEPRRPAARPAIRNAPVAGPAVVRRWARHLSGPAVGPGSARRWVLLLPVAAVALLASPLLGMAVPAAAAAWHLGGRRLARRRADAARATALPEVLELVAVAIRAGGTVRAAIVLVAERGPSSVTTAFQDVLAGASAGLSVLDALEDLPTSLGEGYRPLAAALVAAERDGAPLVGVVAQLARDAHDARRREAEATARRVPVRLLLPLVCCTLPAVLIVTIVPLAAVGSGLAG